MHKDLQLFLNVYVDDFKLCGKAKSIPVAWAMLRKHLDLDEPTRYTAYLGCNIRPLRLSKELAIQKCRLFESIFGAKLSLDDLQ